MLSAKGSHFVGVSRCHWIITLEITFYLTNMKIPPVMINQHTKSCFVTSGHEMGYPWHIATGQRHHNGCWCLSANSAPGHRQQPHRPQWSQVMIIIVILRNIYIACLWWRRKMETFSAFSRYRPFVRGIHRSPVNSPHKGQWRGALMFSLIWAWKNGRVSNRYVGDLRRHRAHYDVTVIMAIK